MAPVLVNPSLVSKMKVVLSPISQARFCIPQAHGYQFESASPIQYMKIRSIRTILAAFENELIHNW